MAGMRELKKHLKSVNTTGQLAGAMKTVSSAKFSKLSTAYASYSEYANACGEIIELFGDSLGKILPCKNPDAPECYVIIASNRGLCGGYNTQLLSFADEIITELDKSGKNYKIITVNKITEAYCREHGVKTEKSFILPDVPDYQSTEGIRTWLTEQYTSGTFSSVSFIYERYKNTLTQIPTLKKILPLTSDNGETQNTAQLDAYFIPDKTAVMKNACMTCLNSTMYSLLLEAATGAQAATLMAMREASDNAQDTSAAIELEISRKRQSEVTSSVIETYSPEEEDN